MKKILVCVCAMALFMGSCSNKCTPKKATEALNSKLTSFHKVKVDLVKEENCSYLYSVKTKEFKTPLEYMVVRDKNKVWTVTHIK